MSLNEGREKEAFHIIFPLLRLDSAIKLLLMLTAYPQVIILRSYTSTGLHFPAHNSSGR